MKVFVANSSLLFSWMKIYYRAYDHIKDIHDRLQDDAAFSFIDIFAPDVEGSDDNIIADVVVGVVTLGAIGVGSVADTRESSTRNIESG